MPSRLSSLLVRDGLVGVKRMEKAFQRQVIYGGTLDTILLEMNLVPEERLLQYLSLATGVPPATRGETDVFDARAVRVCPREVAAQCQVAPLSFDGETLRVVVKEPVDFRQLEELADALELPIQPLVVPEYRFHVVFDRAYGQTTKARYASLANRSRDVASTVPVGKPATVIVAAAREVVDAGDGEDTATGPDAEVVDVALPPSSKSPGPLPAALDEAAPAAAEPTRAPAAPAAQAAPPPVPTRAPAAQAAPPRVPTRTPAASTAPPPAPTRAPAAPTAPPSAATATVAPPPPGPPAPPTPAAASRPADPPDADAVPEPIADRGSEEPTAPHSLAAAARRAERRANANGRAARTETGADERGERVRAAPPGAIADERPAVEPPRADESPGPADDDSPAAPPPSIAPISAAEAVELLERAASRDEVFLALLRAIRARAWYAALLTIQGDRAHGRLAIAGSTLDADTIAQVYVPLDRDSPFRTAVGSASPYIGPLATGDAEIDAMTRRMGGVMPPAALLMPIALRNRAVALAIGHRGADAISISEVASLLPLTGATADAISRLILEAKQRGGRLPTVPGELAPLVARAAQASAPGAAAPVPAAPATAPAADAAPDWTRAPEALASPRLRSEPTPSATAEAPATTRRSPEQLLAAIEADEPDPSAIAEGIDRYRELLPLLSLHFPGRLQLDRYAVGGRSLRAEQSGPMLAFIVRLGARSIDLLAEKVRDDDRDVRYYATLCLSELRPRQALRDLVDRLFDADYGVRRAAIGGLGGYPARELEPALEPVRRALRATDGARVDAAATALGELADVRAVADMIDALAEAGNHAESLREALVKITKQDHGTSVRKWRSWLAKNRDRSRVEWLIDSLAHRSSALRQAAAEELRRVTGEYFGYHHDLPKREREQARRAWTRWWSEAGRHRFSGTDDAAS